jgi:tetratricopeptide (TPR) repeat protein
MAMGVHVQEQPSLEALRSTQQGAVSEADRAIALGPDLPDGYLARSVIRAWSLFDWGGAEADLQRARELGPETSRSLAVEGYLLQAKGRVSEAIGRYERISEIDPLYAGAWETLAWLRAITGQFDRARADIRRAQEIAPGSAGWTAGRIEFLAGNPTGALAIFQRLPLRSGQLMGSALCLDRLGRRAEADETIAELERAHSHVNAFELGMIYASRGDRDRAFEWLERAYGNRDGGLTEIKSEPSFAALRGDPRYTALLRKMSLPVD